MRARITNTNNYWNEPSWDKLFDMAHGGIERQEAQGQRELVKSSQLPAKINSPHSSEITPDPSETAKPFHQLVYERLGCKVLGITEGDEMFVDVELPEGWTLKSTDHSMWSELRDEKSRKRGSIFYKAAFYDRSAHFNVTQRYTIEAYVSSDAAGNPVDYGKHTHFATYAKDADTFLKLFSVRPEGEYASDEERERARQWLDENYPDNDDCFAYWKE